MLPPKQKKAHFHLVTRFQFLELEPYIYICKSYIHVYIGSSNFGKFACRINLHGMSVSYIHLNTILCDILKTLTSRVFLKPIVGFA